MNHNFDSMMEANASVKPGKKAAPQLDHLRLIPAQAGGHVVEHHMKNSGPGAYHEPETHVFGKGDGKALMAHLAKHGKIEIEVADDKDSAAGAAT
jgi:hypothetical protein